MTCRDTSHGWPELFAFNPIETFCFRQGDQIEDFYRFVNKHRGNFVAGYISYDLGYELYGIEKTVPNIIDVPLIQFAAYNGYCQFQKESTQIHFTDTEYLSVVERIFDRKDNTKPVSQSCRWTVQLKEEEYRRNVEKIIDYIKAGDIYQINYTHLMQGETVLSGRRLFAHFLGTNPVDFAAYWELPEFSIISLSPERFIRIRNQKIVTCPIKGTRTRGKTEADDREMQRQLFGSKKEQAELYMITDLLRNDLGKISKIGSVKVVHRKKLQKLANVFHTYSKIESDLKDTISGIEALISMFPGGSITGCPKKRAIEIIDEIEASSRGVYTGCIGYILPNQSMEFNIAIRTIIKRGDQLFLGVGGGITIESNTEEEFEETLAKARSFFY